MIARLFGWAPGPMLALAFLSCVSNLLALAGSIYMLQVYDRVLTSKSLPTLVALTLMLAGAYVFYAIIETVRGRMTNRLSGLIEERLTERTFEALIGLRLVNHTDTDPVRDLASVRQFVGGSGPLALMDLPWIPIYIVILYVFHPLIGTVTVCGAAVMFCLVILSEIMARAPTRELASVSLQRQRLSESAAANPDILAAMGMTQTLTARWSDVTGQVIDAQMTSGDQTATFSSITKSVRSFLQSAVLATGAYLVINGEMTGGFMIGGSILAGRALAPVEQVVAQWRVYLSARQAWHRLNEVLRRLPDPTDKLELPLPTSALRVCQLAVTAPQGQQPVIRGIDFALEAGDGLGVLGPSGAGKSTLARALVGAVPTAGGEIRLDGAQLSSFGNQQAGRFIGYLPQTIELFEGTIAENIARFHPDATDAEILLAAKDAYVHELISSLPEGYDTQIKGRGLVLSTGMRQRVGLARAMFRRPFLLVLDEPNSNLDAEGDTALASALMEARGRGSIVVVVAHRPSGIAAVNKLLYMNRGAQVLFGPKSEVLSKITRPQEVERPAKPVAVAG